MTGPAVTLQTVGPVLQEHGAPWQRDFFLPRILAGEIHFAIGYTEPEAGPQARGGQPERVVLRARSR